MFFRARYDYQRTLRDISKALASVMRIRQLVKYIVEALVETIKVEEISFLILDDERKRYRSVPIEYKKDIGLYNKIEMDPGSRIISYLKLKKKILLADEIGYEISELKLRKNEQEKISILEELRDEIERMGIAVWVPVISKNELIGIISLGYKMSGDMYTEEDLRLLVTLSNQLAIALDNARLYEELLETKNYSENILYSMISGVASTDLSGKVVTFNKAFESITGLDKGKIKDNDIRQLFSESTSISELIKNAF